ncbi:MAG TPA: VOC family protein [Mycobacteriales bacterium]|nr:VOC family protein [Mycobacteriales bacterium]
MPTRDSAWPAGTPCWIDYSAEDVGAAQRFYSAVLGWAFTEGRPEFGGYLTCLTNGLGAAGMMPKMEASQPSAWTTYFATDNTGQTASAIGEAGGTVVAGPHAVGSLGTMTIALDPVGVMFGTWEASEHTGVQIYNEPGSLVWNEAAMPDPSRAKAFYSEVFGFGFDPVEGVEDYATFTLGDGPLGGLGGHSPGSPQGWLVCFSVASTDEAVAAVESGGGKTLTAPQDTPFGRFAVVADPWGAEFELMSAPAAE